MRDEAGVTSAEAAVLFVVISVGTLLAWVAFGQSLAGLFGDDNAKPSSQQARSSSTSGSSRSGGSAGPFSGLGDISRGISMPGSPGGSGASSSGGILGTLANSSIGQGVLGIGYGLQKSFTPGGFLAPNPSERPAFEVGTGIGEILGGATQMGGGSALTGAGVGIAGLGVAAEGPSLGTSTVAVLGGAAVATAGAAVVGNGVANVAAGGNHIINAARGSGSDGEVSGGSSNGPPEQPSGPTEPYNRKKHYGKTPTQADRKAVGAGEGEVADHDPPLVKRYYEGDPANGEKPGWQMTQQERQASARDRTRMSPQPRADSDKQGADMSKYSKDQKKKHGL